MHQYHYAKQGVRYSCWWAPISDTMALAKCYDSETGLLPLSKMIRDMFVNGDPNTKLPTITGVHLAGNPFLTASGPEAFEQIFIPLAKYVSKNPAEKELATLMLPDAIFFKDSHESDFKPRRRSLSSSLFKAKLLSMMEDIKKLTLIKIKERENEKELDIVDFFLNL